MEMKDFHLKEAKRCFNSTWDYIDKEERSVEDEMEMIRLSHTSRYHWGHVGTPLEFERGDWLISKVYALIGQGTLALAHAYQCLSICEKNNIKDIDICFAYEAIAKAYKVLGNNEKVKKYKALAYENLEAIENDGDKEYTKSELDKI